MSERVAMGIDASLTGTGLVAVPFNWGLDWSKVARCKLGLQLSKGSSELERMKRIDFICTGMMKFAEVNGVTDVFMEGYAFAAPQRAHGLGEIGGNLKRDVLIGMGLPLTVVPVATARTVLGKFSKGVPKLRRQKGDPKPLTIKDQVHVVLRRVGLPLLWDGDETDAWVVANYGLSGIEGADAIILREV